MLPSGSENVRSWVVRSPLVVEKNGGTSRGRGTRGPMPERLTESLKRQGHLDATSARKALERQVLLGGALDTALLELQLGLFEAHASYGVVWAELERVVGQPVPARPSEDDMAQ